VGDAFLAQEADVMATIQDLRARASAAGNLRSTEQQLVKREGTIIVVEPANPQVVYVPVYSPTVVYGPWWYPAYPPYVVYPYRYYPGAAIASGVIVFGTAVAVAVAWNHWWGYWDWRHRNVYVNVNRTVNIHKTTVIHTRQIQTTAWRHDPVHRKGVSYRDPRTREKYAPSNRQAVDNRRDYRGYEKRGQTRPASTVDRPAPDRKQVPGAVQRPPAQARQAPAVTQPPAQTRQAPAVKQPPAQARQAPAVTQPPAQTRQAPAVSRSAAPNTIYGVEQGNKVRKESTRGRESLSLPKGKQGEAPKAAPAASRPAPAQKPAPAQGGRGQRQDGGGPGRR